MNNRDYFKKPIQSDRNTQDYGNTKLERDAPPMWQGPMWLYALAGIAFALAVAISA